MSKLTKQAYKQLMDEYCEDVRNWLPNMIGQVESDHICQILQASVDHEYPETQPTLKPPTPNPNTREYQEWLYGNFEPTPAPTDNTVRRYMAYKHPDSEIVSIVECEIIWNVHHTLNDVSHQLHVSKATLKDWEQRQNREPA